MIKYLDGTACRVKGLGWSAKESISEVLLKQGLKSHNEYWYLPIIYGIFFMIWKIGDVGQAILAILDILVKLSAILNYIIGSILHQILQNSIRYL